MKYKKLNILFQFVLICFTLISTTYGWYTNIYTLSTNVELSSENDYFGGGTGEIDNPYIISLPIHLYNLAWLQDLGHFDGDDKAYFSLQPYGGAQTLDMTGYVLPPIGIDGHPFVSCFEGNSKTIANLTIATDFSNILDKPGSTVLNAHRTDTIDNNEIIITSGSGTFGVVGKASADASEIETAQIKNAVLENITIVGYNKVMSSVVEQENVNVGLIAGTVASCNMSGIGVYGGNIKSDLSSDASNSKKIISKYTLIGEKNEGVDMDETPGLAPGGTMVFDVNKFESSYNQGKLQQGVVSTYPGSDAATGAAYAIGQAGVSNSSHKMDNSSFLSYYNTYKNIYNSSSSSTDEKKHAYKQMNRILTIYNTMTNGNFTLQDLEGLSNVTTNNYSFYSLSFNGGFANINKNVISLNGSIEYIEDSSIVKVQRSIVFRPLYSGKLRMVYYTTNKQVISIYKMKEGATSATGFFESETKISTNSQGWTYVEYDIEKGQTYYIGHETGNKNFGEFAYLEFDGVSSTGAMTDATSSIKDIDFTYANNIIPNSESANYLPSNILFNFEYNPNQFNVDMTFNRRTNENGDYIVYVVKPQDLTLNPVGAGSYSISSA